MWAAMMAAQDSGSSEQQQQPQPPPPPPPVEPTRKEDPSPKLSAAFRSAAVASLNKRLQASLAAIAQQAVAEAEEQLGVQATLRQRGEQLQSEITALQVGLCAPPACRYRPRG